jgi:hypothetical protein
MRIKQGKLVLSIRIITTCAIAIITMGLGRNRLYYKTTQVQRPDNWNRVRLDTNSSRMNN